MTKLIATSRSFVNAPKMVHSLQWIEFFFSILLSVGSNSPNIY